MSLPQLPEPLFLLYTGKIYAGEQDDWDIEPASGKDVDAFANKHPEQTIGLHSDHALRAFGEACVAAERERCAQIVEAEHVLDSIGAENGDRGDLAYNRALRHAAAAIRSAK